MVNSQYSPEKVNDPSWNILVVAGTYMYRGDNFLKFLLKKFWANKIKVSLNKTILFFIK